MRKQDEQSCCWWHRIIDDFVALEKHIAPWDLAHEGAPDWVRNVAKELANSVLPTKLLVSKHSLNPYVFGRLFGQHCAHVVWMFESLERLERERGSEGVVQACGAASQGRGDFAELLTWSEGLRKLVKKAFCLAVDNDYESMADYVKGFGEGFRKKPKVESRGGVGTTAFDVYIVLMCAWPTVQRLESVRQLHDVLRKTLGEGRVGGLKRVEKICQRIRLRLAKPGRPKRKKR